jgi:Protein of unknown function (DUF2899).
MLPQDALDILIVSIRDGFVQVSAFVAVTVLLFSYLQYRTSGRIVTFLRNHRRMQPIAGALLGLTPGCGGAIVAMPLYIRGTISFGSVVATLGATAGDSAFVILAIAPGAGVYAYGLAFAASVAFGYAIDHWGIGRPPHRRGRRARCGRDASGERRGLQRGRRGAQHGDGVPGGAPPQGCRLGGRCAVQSGPPRRCALGPRRRPRRYGLVLPAPVDASGPHESADASGATNGASGVLTTISHVVHLLWWGVAAAGLVAGVMYLARGAPEVAVEVAPTFFGLFTVAGVTGTVLSFYLYFVGRHYMDEAGAGRLRDRFGSAYETFQHAAMETSMVTVWVLAGYLLYEYTMGLFALDLRALSTMAGVFAPAAGAALGLVPGCTPQIIFAQLYAVEEVIPFSALAANAISQDGDALFPLMAIDMKAALIATIYTTIPALVVGALVYYLWPFARFGFGVLG